jgi:hypothetical protein
MRDAPPTSTTAVNCRGLGAYLSLTRVGLLLLLVEVSSSLLLVLVKGSTKLQSKDPSNASLHSSATAVSGGCKAPSSGEVNSSS